MAARAPGRGCGKSRNNVVGRRSMLAAAAYRPDVMEAVNLIASQNPRGPERGDDRRWMISSMILKADSLSMQQLDELSINVTRAAPIKSRFQRLVVGAAVGCTERMGVPRRDP